MFRTNSDSLPPKQKAHPSAPQPMNLSVLNAVPSAADSIAALDRPQGLKLNQIVSAKRCIDEHMDSKSRSGLHGTRIGADSRTESHKEIMRIDSSKRQLIIQTYNKMKAGGINNGLMVFIRMFAENPQYKDIWPQFRAITDSSLISSDQLRNHVKVYSGGMHSIVDLMNADDETELRNLIRRMARSHAKFGVHKYHIMSMLPEFIAVLKAAGVELTPEIEEAWRTIFDVIGNLLSKLKT